MTLGMQVIDKGFKDLEWDKIGREALIGAISGAVLGGAFGAVNHYLKGGKVVADNVSGLSKAQNNMNTASKALSNGQRAFKNTNSAISYLTNTVKYSTAATSVEIAKMTYAITLVSYKNC